jgi:hypothetical protein
MQAFLEDLVWLPHYCNVCDGAQKGGNCTMVQLARRGTRCLEGYIPRNKKTIDRLLARHEALKPHY